MSLSWIASISSGLQGYNVYRSNVSGGPYSRLSSVSPNALGYTDTTPAAGKKYFYVVTSVSSSGSESAASNEIGVAIPTP